jgi:hypothetical protein
MRKRSGLADSPFFNSPNETTILVDEAADSAASAPPVRDVRGVLPVRLPKRVLKRHPFDIYADQLDRLKELKAQAMRRGEEASMSQMVREALDQFIERRS